MTDKFQKFFLAANSCEGFISHFADNYDAKSGWRAFIIKGGPGTGKSSFMKQFAYFAAEKGEEVILCPCSSDPDSLDGVILPYKKMIILDGTAPHIVEPKFAGICEEIVNLGAFWDSEKIRLNKNRIFDIYAQNALLHKRASGYLRAAGKAAEDNFRIAAQYADIQTAFSFAEKTAKKILPPKNKKGTEWIRFLQGTTPKGIVSFNNTIEDFYDRKIVVSDPYGPIGDVFMRTIRDVALNRGYEIISIKSAFLPDTILEQVLVPELSIAFVTENRTNKFRTQERKIHARRFMNVAQLNSERQKILFNKKIAVELVAAAAKTLETAKNVHDNLEKYYISAMDWDSLNAFLEKFIKDTL